ncbi:hypothetical protein RB653_003442 [Dictyostelium firmibasis]|uniref:Uncharacterized protein n=1 Tax=Dictyostelium firmibasis TaxID=79012 RepID=A0AAN7U4T2_9MYCE
MPLNLVARKSLRDNEEHLNKAHEEIKNSLDGEEWIIEFDWDVIFDKVDEHIKKQLGEVFYKNLCPNISKCIASAAKDEITKESIINANTAKKIVLMVYEDPKNSAYWKYEFKNGQLNLLFKKGCNNITEAANFELYKVIPSEGVYTLPTRLSLKNNQEKFDLAFERIKSVTKRDWSFDEASMEQVYSTGFETDNQREQFGNTFSQILDNIAKNIENRCKDDMTLESFNDVTANGRISFRHNPKQTTGYWAWSFSNGDLIISFKSICNVSDNASFDFIKVLPVPGVFSLGARLNMKVNQEKFDNAFERIKEVTNMDWSYEQESLEQVYPSLEERNKERVGDLFAEILKYIADNITKRCKSDIVLEAFSEASSNAKIVFRHNPKASGYWNWTFEGGNLIVTFKSICNTSENANFDFIKVLPVPGVFSLAAKINLKENQEKFDESFQRIKETTNMDWSYDEQSLETVYPSLEERNKERVGDLFSDIVKYIADNIVKRCKDDMVLECFTEATSNAKIVFRYNSKASGYWNWTFENNDLVITFKSISNISDNSNFDFIKILPTPGVLTLASRINLKDNQEKVNESFEKIKEVLGSDWTYDESSLEQVYPKLEENNKPRVGDILSEIIRYISQNIVKRCKDDDMVKEGFVEATQNCKIIFQHIEKQSTYWVWKFDNGNLVVSFKSICNVSDNANFNFEALL